MFRTAGLAMLLTLLKLVALSTEPAPTVIAPVLARAPAESVAPLNTLSPPAIEVSELPSLLMLAPAPLRGTNAWLPIVVTLLPAVGKLSVEPFSTFQVPLGMLVVV